MFAAPFNYHAPATLDEAVSLLGTLGPDTKVISGGMSLVPMMKFRFAQPRHLVDLRRIQDLRGISAAGDEITIGARTTHAELEASLLLQEKCPLLAQCATMIGDLQVRNRGTIGGSLMHADPGADLPAAILALDATLTLAGRTRRTVAAADFFAGALTTVAQSDEILVDVRVRATPPTVSYQKLAQQASGFALVGIAAVLDMQGDVCAGARVGVAGVSAVPFRARSVEQALQGQTLTMDVIQAAAAQIHLDIQDPLSDPLNGSVEYRANAARVYAERAIAAATRRQTR
jgi:aerobic carbon-monoxide dehydrogenase medium subunit